MSGHPRFRRRGGLVGGVAAFLAHCRGQQHGRRGAEGRHAERVFGDDARDLLQRVGAHLLDEARELEDLLAREVGQLVDGQRGAEGAWPRSSSPANAPEATATSASGPSGFASITTMRERCTAPRAGVRTRRELRGARTFAEVAASRSRAPLPGA